MEILPTLSLPTSLSLAICIAFEELYAEIKKMKNNIVLCQ
jgi:hypothetical protein